MLCVEAPYLYTRELHPLPTCSSSWYAEASVGYTAPCACWFRWSPLVEPPGAPPHPPAELLGRLLLAGVAGWDVEGLGVTALPAAAAAAAAVASNSPLREGFMRFMECSQWSRWGWEALGLSGLAGGGCNRVCIGSWAVGTRGTPCPPAPLAPAATCRGGPPPPLTLLWMSGE